MTPVTGFALFTLCHSFGRRGRAFARSIARQSGCPAPLALTVFYSRPEDGRQVAQGFGEDLPREALTLCRVPEELAMRRGLHFAQAHTMHRLSHTVFVDADLWFPPTFWKEYTAAVESETVGYWSCRVMNVPLPSAEGFVDRWEEIAPEALDAVARERRLDRYAGKVGHFQCIPRDLLQYPADPRPAVHSVDLAFSKVAIEQSVDRRSERRISRIPAFHFDHPPSWEGTGGIDL